MTSNWANDIREGAMEEWGFQRNLGEREKVGSLSTRPQYSALLERLLEILAA